MGRTLSAEAAAVEGSSADLEEKLRKVCGN
jgi:hypothetical protein